MGKTVGDPAEIIRSLREALAADQEENRSFRALQAENARLKMKIEILQTIVKPPKDLDDLAGSRVSTPSDSISQNKPGVPQDIGRSIGSSITIHGDRYVYHEGRLIRLDTRLSRISSRPSYMHPTQASEAKVASHRESRVYPIYYLRNWREGRTATSPTSAVAEVRSFDPKEAKSWWRGDQGDLEKMALEDEKGRLAPAEPEAFRLREGPRSPLIWTSISSEYGEAIVQRGLRYLQESFRAAARVHWPQVFQLIKGGPHLVKLSASEMGQYLICIGIRGLKLICPHDPWALNRQLELAISRIRNDLAHPNEVRFSYTGSLDDYLREIQKCLLLMGDNSRAKATRALRDELVMEAEAQIHVDDVMNGFSEMPFNQSEEDWDASYPTPEAWAGVLM